MAKNTMETLFRVYSHINPGSISYRGPDKSIESLRNVTLTMGWISYPYLPFGALQMSHCLNHDFTQSAKYICSGKADQLAKPDIVHAQVVHELYIAIWAIYNVTLWLVSYLISSYINIAS